MMLHGTAVDMGPYYGYLRREYHTSVAQAILDSWNDGDYVPSAQWICKTMTVSKARLGPDADVGTYQMLFRELQYAHDQRAKTTHYTLTDILINRRINEYGRPHGIITYPDSELPAAVMRTL